MWDSAAASGPLGVERLEVPSSWLRASSELRREWLGPHMRLRMETAALQSRRHEKHVRLAVEEAAKIWFGEERTCDAGNSMSNVQLQPFPFSPRQPQILDLQVGTSARPGAPLLLQLLLLLCDDGCD